MPNDCKTVPTPADADGPAAAQERTVAVHPGFEGRLVKVEVHEVVMPDGRRTRREILRHPGAAVVLAEDADGRFLLVRQYRKAVERRLLEVVAGTLDPGETPETCARREVEEETGRRALSLSKLGVLCPAPGYSSEYLHIYHARVAPATASPRHAPDPDEWIEVVALGAADIEARIDAGEIEDAKTLAAWLLYRRAARTDVAKEGSGT
jgi:ADP-ribose pyrophosphatase